MTKTIATKRYRGRVLWLVAGLAMGLLFGLGTTAGVLCSGKSGTATPPGWPQGLPLNASSACTSETLAIATGPVDESVEGIFTLDFISGDLQCFVVNPRTGKFVGWFKTNVTRELTVEKGKKPQYLLATGGWSPVGSTTNQRPASCIAYVADANTGLFAAYTFPWVKGAAAAGITQATPMVPMDMQKARIITTRE